MDLGLENKVALITGGGSGIGRATAVAFSEEGAKVVVADLNAVELGDTVKIVKQTGVDCVGVIADVTKPEDVRRMIKKTIDTYGQLDCAVNNAGYLTRDYFLDCTEEEWDKTMNINLKGVWMCMMNEIPRMLKQGRGSIVNISSMVGLVAAPKHTTYCTSKHGVVGLTKSASVEFVGKGIRINTICPGSINTPMLRKAVDAAERMDPAKRISPMGRIGEPEEIAAAVVFLCSDKASFIAGITMCVDGGFTQH